MGVARSVPVTWQATKGNNYATLVTHTNDGRIGRVSSSIRVCLSVLPEDLKTRCS